MQASVGLPESFKDLERFVDYWARATTDARHHQRQTSSMEGVRAFYDALQPRVLEILKHLDQAPLEDLRVEDRRLMQLAMSFVEAALAVELFHVPGVADVPYPHGLSVVEELPAMVRAMQLQAPPNGQAAP